MKAVAIRQSLPLTDPNALLDLELAAPVASGRDLLVEVKAISVNPIDCKMRMRALPQAGGPKVLGWDAVGVVKAVGPEASLFKVGDEVFYAGDVTRDGSNSELQLIDERIVGRKPAKLSWAESAAVPLTSVTAWEMLFDRLQLPKDDDKAVLLISGAAGGVGSIMIQLAKALTKAKVIATASRETSQAWVSELGADLVVNHHQGLANELANAGIANVTHIASLTHTHQHFNDFATVIAPQGKICLIDDPAEPLDIMQLKAKSVSLIWELMFTRSRFQTDDMIEQHNILNQVADLLDNGRIRSTLQQNLGRICAENVKQAHLAIESGQTIGKIVLEGF